MTKRATECKREEWSAGGIFTISLDFELFWGTRDHASTESYGENILGTERAVPRILAAFEKHQIHATWAFVGLLAFDDAAEALQHVPNTRPRYANPRLNPYGELDALPKDPERARYFFAPHLLKLIASTPHQELGSHTFSHYYCLEPGQGPEAFLADLQAMAAVTQNKLLRHVTSLVFPRNQSSEDYLALCAVHGMRAFRGNPRSWIYAARPNDQESLVRRAARLADAYVNLTGHHGYQLGDLARNQPVDVPASRFLRPYSRKLKALEPIRLRRILNDMTHCARQRRLYHLWWHPENFGADLEENMRFLTRILVHYDHLRKRYGMATMTMGEVAEVVDGLNGAAA